MTFLTVKQFKDKIKSGTIILDTRDPLDFARGFIPGSMNIPLNHEFKRWATLFLGDNQSVILVIPAGKEDETTKNLASVGIRTDGILEGGFARWQKEGEKIDLIIDIEADEFAMDLSFDKNIVVLDVRSQTENAVEHVKDAVNIPLNELTDIAQIASLEEDEMVYIYSGQNGRSVIAASLLKRHGYHMLRIITGGFEGIKDQKNIPLEKDKASLN